MQSKLAYLMFYLIGSVMNQNVVRQFQKKTIIIFIMLGKENKRRTHLTETFQSQINQERGSRFLMDRTLYKGIKDNDFSKIIDVSKESGQLTDKALPNELQQLQKIVIQMRKKYDQARTQTIQVQSQLQKLRKASEIFKEQQKLLKQAISGAKSVLFSLKQNLESKQKQSQGLFVNVQSRTYDLEIYKQMVATLKHDILIIKKRNFDRDIVLKQDRTRIKSLKNNDFHKTQFSYKCRDILQSVQKAVINKQNQRNSKLNTFYDALNKKHENIRRQGERERQIQEVMIKAMSQKLQEQKQWINICNVNLFLKRFLKFKMERLINQNAQIEGAYHKIRSNTDIKDCKDLITRFLNRQKDYGTILGSISEKEARLESQKYQKEKLQAKNHELTQNSQQISESTHKSKSIDSPLLKQLTEVEQTLKQIQSKKQLINKWATRLFCSFSNKTRDQINQKYTNKPLTNLTKDVLLQISKFLSHLLGTQNCSDSINNAFMSTRPSEKTFTQEIFNRNNRVKTMAVEEDYFQGDDREANQDGNSQAQFLHYNRRLTKKNDINRRFRIKTQLK